MTTIAVPTAGAPILDTWGADVANRLNRIIPIGLSADFASNSGSIQYVPELTWDIVAGRLYVARLFGSYEAAHTSQGLELGFLSEDTGVSTEDLMMIQVNHTTTSRTNGRIVAPDVLGGPTTVDTANSPRGWWADFVMTCSTSGTMSIGMARGGGNSTSPGVTLKAGSGGFVLETA